MTISYITDATLTQMDWETSSRDRCSLLSRSKIGVAEYILVQPCGKNIVVLRKLSTD